MSTLSWIVLGGIAMSAIALVGSVTLLLEPARLERLLLPLVAFAAGSLLGGAFFHLLPGAIGSGMDPVAAFAWATLGFSVFMATEQLLHHHHCHRAATDCREPLTYLVLLGDGLHNFLGGLAVGATFVMDVRLGIMAWIAAAAHEVPQELGDFAVLVHGGWARRSALLFNLLSGITFLVGALAAYFMSLTASIVFLVPFAAGNFLYIGASDLVPEVNKHAEMRRNVEHFLAFGAGLVLLLVLQRWVG
jgi:zinc and cadmium transporter